MPQGKFLDSQLSGDITKQELSKTSEQHMVLSGDGDALRDLSSYFGW